MYLPYGRQKEILDESLLEANKLPSSTYAEDLIFHAYWDGELVEQHLISITSCWLFNVKGRSNRKIKLWVKNSPDNKCKEEISKYADIIEYDFEEQVLGTPFEGKSFYAIERPAYFSDVVRYGLLYKFGGLWFDLDVFFLKSIDPVLSSFSEKVFLYRWSHEEFPNGAIYFSPAPKDHELTKIIDIFLEKNIGFGFNETKVGFDTDVGFTVLPCAWFDPAWLENDCFDDFSQFFYRNKASYTLNNFFSGAFAYHWHNRWNFPIKEGSVISDLYNEVKSLL